MKKTTKSRTGRSNAAAKGPTPWWGDRGLPPHLRWLGSPSNMNGPGGTRAVTIDIPAVWNEKNKRWESHGGKYFFDKAKGENAASFFPTILVHHIGEWADKPFELLDYQRLLLTMPIFGWKHASTGFRRFRKVFAFLPKGSGKSPWGSGTALYCEICDDEPAAEVYVAAGDRDQARIIHDNSKIMVEKSPDLMEECEITRDAIRHESTKSTFKVLSAEASTKHGFRPSCVIFDEFHAQKNRDLYEALRKSMPKRRQPLMVLISHSGTDDEGICYEEYEYAKKVLAGVVPDEATLPVIFEMTAEDDWTDPDVWFMVNPGHGITIKHDGVLQESMEAQAEPRKRNDFLRYHGNVWTNQEVAWIPSEWWSRCDKIASEDALKNMVVTGGLDGAQKIDLASFVLTFREMLETEDAAFRSGNVIEIVAENSTPEQKVVVTKSLNFRLHVLPFFWIPENTMKERIKNDRVPYDIWRDLGFVKATRGDTIDYDVIVRDIRELCERFPHLKESQIGYDPAFMDDVAQRLIGPDKENPEINMLEILQNYRYLSEPSQIFEALLKARRVVHDGNKCMKWNVECVSIKTDDAARIRPVKSRNSTKRIDGVVATVMGLSRLIVAPDLGFGDSVYETRGVVVL